MRERRASQPHLRLRDVTVAIILGMIAALAVPSASSAADADDFNPGFLISDADFFDSTSLTAAGADSFIDSMNKGCLVGRVCLENYKESITAKAKNDRCAAIAAASSRTAGQIIATVARACGISPKAILVILQKEQSLVTSQAPSATAFQASMGAGCPDTAPCDGRYAGFYENVYYGAYLLKGYTMPSSSLYKRYPAGATSNILYNPKGSCGTKPVYVVNQATHALYVYTPYTPNAAALKNLYGTGDSCSSYGNRNFWRLWTDWFGPTGEMGVAAIESYYALNGGATAFGTPVGDPEAYASFGGGLMQRYSTGGAMIWTENQGVTWLNFRLVNGLDEFGGPAVMGWPISEGVTEAGVGNRISLTKGDITYTLGSGYHKISAAYLTTHAALGGYNGVLGWPIGNVAGDAQQFTGAWLFYNRPEMHITVIANEVADRYRDTGGPLTWGNSTSDLITTEDGAYQLFQKGAAVATADGTFMVAASTTSAWQAAGGADGVLGLPTADRTFDSATREIAQTFQGGTVYTGALGNGYVAKQFEDRIATGGGITGKYGFPTGGLRSNASGFGQDFGIWSMALTEQGVYSIHTTSLNAWRGFGSENGYLGWPISQQAKSGTLYSQTFEHGTLFFTSAKKGYIGEHFLPMIAQYGGVNGTYGWPSGGVFVSKSSGGGELQTFGTRMLAWSPSTGTRSIWGTMLTTWKANGAQNTLGWPTGFQATDAASGARYQDFTKGRTYATSAKSGWVQRDLVSAYADAGGPSGPWGWPVAAPVTTEGVLTQKFAKGTATFDGTTVTFAAGA